nr:GNAT family N-acetyltransferase [endosymbiont 'TC1' of Trimyema compressum]
MEGAYVNENYRGQGLMSQMEAKMIDYFRGLGLVYCELCIISKNQMARDCWEHLGYKTFREQMRKSILER